MLTSLSIERVVAMVDLLEDVQVGVMSDIAMRQHCTPLKPIEDYPTMSGDFTTITIFPRAKPLCMCSM